MMSRYRVAAALSVLLLICPTASLADNDEALEVYQDIVVPGQDTEDLFTRVKKLRPRGNVFTRGMLDGDFGDADVDWVQSYGRVALPIPLSEQLVLVPSIAGGIAAYDFSGDGSFLDAGQRPGGDPFDDLYHTQLRLEARYLVNDDWSVLGGAWLTGQWEDGSSFGDAMRVGGMVALSHQLTESISLVGGLGISEGFDSGVSVSPFLGGRWQVNEWLRIQTEGLGLRAEARVNESVRASLFGGYRSKRYRLDDRNDGPDGVGEGWIRDRRLPVGAGIEWRITKAFRLHVDAGAMLEQQLRVFDEDDDEFDTSSMDSVAPFASIRLEVRL